MALGCGATTGASKRINQIVQKEMKEGERERKRLKDATRTEEWQREKKLNEEAQEL